MEVGQELLGHVDRPVDSTSIFEQESKFVTAEARRGVADAGHAPNPLSDCPQHLVADAMAERIVDRLEVVEIDEQHDDRIGVGTDHPQRVIHTVEKQRPVRESGQFVVERPVTQLSFQIALLGHITDRGDPAVDGVTTEQIGDRGLHPATVAIDTHQARLELDHAAMAEPHRLAQLRGGGVTVVARHQIDHRPTGPVARAVPERARQPRARIPDDAVGVDE